jgi:hypothetical protein
MRRQTKTVALAVGAVYDRTLFPGVRTLRSQIRLVLIISLVCALWPLAATAQEEGPREVQVPNPMGAHTWFIIVAVGAFLAWCISYVLQLQKERLSSKPQRESLLRRKDELLDQLAELDSQKEAGTITVQHYEKEFRKTRNRLSAVLDTLRSKQDSAEP